jgi:DNA-3-methyladenine glycosylase I
MAYKHKQRQLICAGQYNRCMSLADGKTRCEWAGTDPQYVEYHDQEWGVPVHDDNKLFEFLVLEGAQAGLSWLTILKRRGGYRQAFADFNPSAVADFSDHHQQELLQDERIIRNRLKVRSAVTNAQLFVDIQKEYGSFDAYQWGFVDGKPLQNSWRSMSDLPAVSSQAVAFSGDLKRRGFKFVGPTIIYAHMQAIGMVNDHTVSCFRHDEVRKLQG